MRQRKRSGAAKKRHCQNAGVKGVKAKGVLELALTEANEEILELKRLLTKARKRRDRKLLAYANLKGSARVNRHERVAAELFRLCGDPKGIARCFGAIFSARATVKKNNVKEMRDNVLPELLLTMGKVGCLPLPRSPSILTTEFLTDVSMALELPESKRKLLKKVAVKAGYVAAGVNKVHDMFSARLAAAVPPTKTLLYEGERRGVEVDLRLLLLKALAVPELRGALRLRPYRGGQATLHVRLACDGFRETAIGGNMVLRSASILEWGELCLSPKYTLIQGLVQGSEARAVLKCTTEGLNASIKQVEEEGVTLPDGTHYKIKCLFVSDLKGHSIDANCTGQSSEYPGVWTKVSAGQRWGSKDEMEELLGPVGGKVTSMYWCTTDRRPVEDGAPPDSTLVNGFSAVLNKKKGKVLPAAAKALLADKAELKMLKKQKVAVDVYANQNWGVRGKVITEVEMVARIPDAAVHGTINVGTNIFDITRDVYRRFYNDDKALGESLMDAGMVYFAENLIDYVEGVKQKRRCMRGLDIWRLLRARDTVLRRLGECTTREGDEGADARDKYGKCQKMFRLAEECFGAYTHGQKYPAQGADEEEGVAAVGGSSGSSGRRPPEEGRGAFRVHA